MLQTSMLSPLCATLFQGALGPSPKPPLEALECDLKRARGDTTAE